MSITSIAAGRALLQHQATGEEAAAGQALLDSLVRVERADDEALAAQAEFLAAMLRTRLEIRVAPEVGHDTLIAAGEVLAHKIGQRGRTIEIHRSLAKLKQRSRLRTTSFGGSDDKEVPKITQNPNEAGASL